MNAVFGDRSRRAYKRCDRLEVSAGVPSPQVMIILHDGTTNHGVEAY